MFTKKSGEFQDNSLCNLINPAKTIISVVILKGVIRSRKSEDRQYNGHKTRGQTIQWLQD